ncbi:MAG TPA: hypothetical protein VKK79_23445, partial [Candidatus Lokiarchaeia archaeon]|nr:hypothetical protein [Candidatus Lokiarchaeia archaeon]
MEKLGDDMTTWAEALMDGIDFDKFIVCTYIVCLPADYEGQHVNIGRVLAEEQSIGTWTHVPQETPEVRRRFIGKLIQCVEIPQFEVMRPERKNREGNFSFFGQPLTPYLMTVAYPTDLFNDDNFPLVLTSIYGNISMVGPIRLVSVRFGKEWMNRFQGPTFGLDGIYEKLKIPVAPDPATRPVTINMIKPKTGITKEVGAELFWEAAIGGVDIIK